LQKNRGKGDIDQKRKQPSLLSKFYEYVPPKGEDLKRGGPPAEISHERVWENAAARSSKEGSRSTMPKCGRRGGDGRGEKEELNVWEWGTAYTGAGGVGRGWGKGKIVCLCQ